jgi:hypothetical protein
MTDRKRHIAKQVVLGLCAFAAAGVLRSSAADTMTDKGDVNQMLASWPADSAKAAKKVMAKYGAPDEATASTLTWYNNGVFKRTVASRTSIMHKFPVPHPDSMEQFVDYRVPLDKYDDLAKFDGSVNVNRTKGELSARCDAETHNLLALNLAHDIITGQRSVAGARAFYGRVVKMELATMKLHPYETRLIFKPMMNMSHDADKQTIKKPMM